MASDTNITADKNALQQAAIGKDAASKDNIRFFAFDPNKWAKSPPEDAAQGIFHYAMEQTDEAVRWYAANKSTKACVSSWLRGIAIFAGIAGGLAPIFAAVAPTVFPATAPSAQLLITQAGYLSVGIAAGALAFDRFFGSSSGWIRYMTAMTAIERLRLEFILDWAKLRREAPEPPDVLKLLDRMTVFRKALYQVVEDETSKWAAEFQAAMSSLDKYVQDTRQQAEATLKEMEKQRAAESQEMAKQRAAPKAGFVNLTLAADWEGDVQIFIEDKLRQTVSGRTAGIAGLTPPSTVVEVRGSKKGKEIRESKVALIKAGEVTELAL